MANCFLCSEYTFYKEMSGKDGEGLSIKHNGIVVLQKDLFTAQNVHPSNIIMGTMTSAIKC